MPEKASRSRCPAPTSSLAPAAVRCNWCFIPYSASARRATTLVGAATARSLTTPPSPGPFRSRWAIRTAATRCSARAATISATSVTASRRRWHSPRGAPSPMATRVFSRPCSAPKWPGSSATAMASASSSVTAAAPLAGRTMPTSPSPSLASWRRPARRWTARSMSVLPRSRRFTSTGKAACRCPVWQSPPIRSPITT